MDLPSYLLYYIPAFHFRLLEFLSFAFHYPNSALHSRLPLILPFKSLHSIPDFLYFCLLPFIITPQHIIPDFLPFFVLTFIITPHHAIPYFQSFLCFDFHYPIPAFHSRLPLFLSLHFIITSQHPILDLQYFSVLPFIIIS